VANVGVSRKRCSLALLDALMAKGDAAPRKSRFGTCNDVLWPSWSVHVARLSFARGKAFCFLPMLSNNLIIISLLRQLVSSFAYCVFRLGRLPMSSRLLALYNLENCAAPDMLTY